MHSRTRNNKLARFTRHNSSMQGLARTILDNDCPVDVDDSTGYHKFEIYLHCYKVTVQAYQTRSGESCDWSRIEVTVDPN